MQAIIKYPPPSKKNKIKNNVESVLKLINSNISTKIVMLM